MVAPQGDERPGDGLANGVFHLVVAAHGKRDAEPTFCGLKGGNTREVLLVRHFQLMGAPAHDETQQNNGQNPWTKDRHDARILSTYLTTILIPTQALLRPLPELTIPYHTIPTVSILPTVSWESFSAKTVLRGNPTGSVVPFGHAALGISTLSRP